MADDFFFRYWRPFSSVLEKLKKMAEFLMLFLMKSRRGFEDKIRHSGDVTPKPKTVIDAAARLFPINPDPSRNP